MSTLHFFPVHRYPDLSRSRIVESALRGDPALVLLWGAGGSGKSTAAAEIAARAAEAARAEAVWVGFGDDQRSASGAWQAILTALLEAGAIDAGSTAAQLREGELAEGVSQIPLALRDALPERLVLVLDDVHLVADRTLEAGLLDALSRSPGLRLVLTSRSRLGALIDVEARMRVPVREIEAAELALTQPEVEQLVDARLPEAAAEARRAMSAGLARNGGVWPMLAHAAIVEHAAGGRAPGATERVLVARHVDRLLRDASQERRDVLCGTALFREVSAAAVAQIFEIEAPLAERMLESVSVSNTGYWEENDGTRWYCHHDLVREELLRRAETVVGADRLRRFYRRAFHAFEDSRPGSAVRAALHAEAWDLLQVILLQRGLRRIVRRDDRNDGLWLRDIPAQVREQYPVLAAFALLDEYAYPRGRFEQVRTGFKALAGSQLAAASAQTGLPGAVASALRMVAARLSGNEELGRRMAERFEEVVDELDGEASARFAHPVQTGITQAAVTHIHGERFEDALRVLERCEPDGDGAPTLAGVHMLALRAFAEGWRGDLPAALAALAACEARELPFGWRSAYVGAGYRIAAAISAIGREELDAAVAHLDALADHEATIEHWPYLVVLRVLVIERQSGALAALAELERQLRARRRRFALSSTHKRLLAETRSRLRWYAGASLPKSDRRRHDLSGVYALLARDAHEPARALLGRLQDDPGLVEQPARRATLLLLQAECARRGGDLEAVARFGRFAARLMADCRLDIPARSIPAPALRELAEVVPELVPWSVRESASAPPAVNALTPGELRAISAVAEHGTTAAAARSLFLSPETVKSNLARVYRKLGVSGRTEAIRIVADAGLLADAQEGRQPR